MRQILFSSLWLVFIFLGRVINVVAQTPDSLPADYTSNMTLNRILVYDMQAPINQNYLLTQKPYSQVKLTAQFLDGLGRPLQTVLRKASMVTGETAKDLVTTYVYDSLGLITKSYLPYASRSSHGGIKTDAFSNQVFFYNSYLADETGETNVGPKDLNWAYEKNVYEKSPLNRIEEQFAAGSSWVGSAHENTAGNRRSAKSHEYFNAVADSVKILHVITLTGTSDYTSLSISGNYPANTLRKYVLTDEQGNTAIEFVDKRNKVILRKVQEAVSARDDGSGSGHTGWACTYYVYDHLGQLRMVIQPEGVQHLVRNNWSVGALNADFYAEQCFRYQYDDRSRVVWKQVPGAAPVYTIYDSRDRAVMIQTGLLRINNQWQYILYDNLNRVTQTGLLTSTTGFEDHLNAAKTSSVYPDLSNITHIVLTETYYDNYNWLSGHVSGLTPVYDGGDDSYLLAASASVWPYPVENITSSLTQGMVTGSMTRVLDTDTLLYTVNIYDEKQRVIQVKQQNFTGGNSVITTQYSWNGSPLVNINRHHITGTASENIITVEKIAYDSLWRVSSVDRQIAGTYTKAAETITTIEYDALGQMKKKKLGNATNPIETLDFSYNIRGFITGLNKEYALNQTSNRYFGYVLGYDKTTIGSLGNFAGAQFNGNITGMNWRSKGDDQIRKFDYSYDRMNRIIAADFNEFEGGNYNRTNGLDFSESDYSYDLNGNILSVNRKGWKAGGSTYIDQLTYNYESLSNKLKNVIDASQDPTSKLGDFKYTQRYHDELGGTKTSSAKDYYYDADGNMVRDMNKYIGTGNVNGIIYNHLNLPKRITLFAEQWEWVKGTVEYIYTADGQKIGKVVRESPYWTPDITYYIGGMVYRNDSLQFISHSEGRTRFKDPRNRSKGLVNDYFITDHLGNVRMVLTEQKDTTVYMATLEAAYRAIEKDLFDHLQESSYPTASVPGGYPEATGNDSLARVNGSGQKVGPSLLLRVMSGDQLDISAKSYYLSRTGSISNVSPVQDILSTLAGGLAGVTGGTHGTTGELGDPLTSPLLPALNFMRTDVNTATPNKPKAWLNWVLLNERLEIVPEGSGGIHVGDADAIRTLAQTGITVPKNGYLYVYVSNETELWDVFFDDIRVAHRSGAILEETHYYPFGLTMQAISSKAANRLKNNFKYNGIELNTDFDLNLYEAFYRSLDPQIGRWWQIDPEVERTHVWSPYVVGFNNPVSNNDPLGNIPEDPTKPYAGGIRLYEVADYLGMVPAGQSRAGEAFTVGDYTVLPNYVQNEDGEWVFSHYTASVMVTDMSTMKPTGRIDYVFGKNDLQAFAKNVQRLGGAADLLYASSTRLQTWQIKYQAGESWFWDYARSVYSDPMQYAGAAKILAFSPGRNVRVRPSAAGKGVINSVDDVIANPQLLKGQSLDQVKTLLGNSEGWVNDVMRRSTTNPNGGWVLREMNKAGTDFTGRMIQYHPGTSRHFGGAPYWKVSSGSGTVRIPVNP